MKKILIMFEENRKIDTYPYVLNLIKMLTVDFQVDFFLPEKMFQECNIPNLQLIKSNHSSYGKDCIKYLKNNGKNYDFVISFSIEGLWALFFYNLRFFGKKLKGAYFSMEFFDKIKKTPQKYHFLWKHFNWMLKSYIAFSVVQDNTRALFVKEYFSFVDKMLLLPNGYIGFTKEKSDFAYKKFNISTDKKILLYSGALERWGFDINLPKYLAPLLEKEYVLLLSGFSRDNYIQTIKEEFSDLIAQNKIIISDENLDENDYTNLVKSAYIGLAWYKEIDITDKNNPCITNIYYMGLSSGKLCKYLSCSIPVILPEFYYGYKQLVEDKKIGQVAPYNNSILEKIIEIDNHYDFYTKNVELFYKKEIEYTHKAEIIIKEINNLLK